MGRKRPEKKSDPIVKYLLENYEINSAQDIEEALKDLLSGTIESLLKAELDEHLDYTLKDTHEYGETPLSLNTRNGSSSKKVKSSYIVCFVGYFSGCLQTFDYCIEQSFEWIRKYRGV